MMQSTFLDDIDERLLESLQRDGRITNRNLAKRLGLSESACSARLRRLEGAGLIAGYAAVLNPALTGHGVRAWLEVRLTDNGQTARGAFEAMIDQSREVIAAYHTDEQDAYLIKIGARDLAGIEDFCAGLRAAESQCEPVRRWLILRGVKLPLPASPRG